ncbi:TPA: hypothetical protein RZK50_001598, partial [Campylobacter coli]|nr:hypothetical protein [Campylobacter coli]
MLHIVVNSSEEYIKYTAVLFTSIIYNIEKNKPIKEFFTENSNFKLLNYNLLCDNEKKEGIVFHILSDGMHVSMNSKIIQLEQKLNQIYPCQIKIYNINPKNFTTMGLKAHAGSLVMYYRILIGSILPEDIEKVLYLDVDMLCFCDLRFLCALDFDGKVVYTSTTASKPKFSLKAKNSTHNDEKENIFFENDYMNIGFMFINLKQWRKLDIENKCLNLFTKYEFAPVMDELCLNYVLQNYIKFLPLEYQVIAYFVEAQLENDRGYFFISFEDEILENATYFINMKKQDFIEACSRVKMIHYCGGRGIITKPWKSIYGALDKYYRPYYHK